jgi:putative PIN family toxin of toxin-antitoxin system
MRKVVLDTNIVVSAAISSYGNPAKIMDMVLDGEIKLYYCTEIKDEYVEVMSRNRMGIPQSLQSDIIAGIERVGVRMDWEPSTMPLPDEDDRAFYDTAKRSGAILVTGNTKHYPDEPDIMTPAIFVDMINRQTHDAPSDNG